jgi:hypothetical protein
MGRLVAISEVPAFPGATNKCPSFLLWVNFQARVCSRPPDPRRRIFISLAVLAKIRYRLESARISP